MTELFDSAPFPIWSTLGLGFFLGLQHAFDPDHLVAVSTIVTEYRTVWKSSLVGASWGLGHTLALVFFGVAVLALRIAITPQLMVLLEMLVAGVFVFLGVHVLTKQFHRPMLHLHRHEHEGVVHSHVHFHKSAQDHQHHHHLLRLGGKPFLVGVVHGLAGTATLMLLVVGVIPSVFMSVAYILIFGLGSVGGMVLVSVLMSLPLALAGRRIRSVEKTLRFVVGYSSVALGLFLAWKTSVF